MVKEGQWAVDNVTEGDLSRCLPGRDAKMSVQTLQAYCTGLRSVLAEIAIRSDR